MFESLYLDILNEHAPQKKAHMRGNQIPFMNEQWRKAIRHHNKLWKKFTHQRTDANYVKYKKQRNKCTSIRRKVIKDHFKNKSETDNPRAFWEAYRPFMHSRSSKQANDITLIENDVVITDKKVAELFNNITILFTSLMMYRTLTLETISVHTLAFKQLRRKTEERMPYIIANKAADPLNLTAGQQEGALERLVHLDEGYKFLKALRGSPCYFERAKNNIFAMIRQLGPATLLPTRWPTPEGQPLSWQIIEPCVSTEEKSHLSTRDPFLTIFGCK